MEETRQSGIAGKGAWQAPFLAALAFLVYLPALRAGFLWDDDSMLTDNPIIRSPWGWIRFWETIHQADFWPVTYSSLWAEWRIWGMNAAGYHLTNVLLHALTVLLFWSVLRKLGIPGAFLAAALFAVHPVNVESVAWIAQRKNLMAMLFFLLSVFFFVEGENRRQRGTGRGEAATGASAIAFLLAMLSKGSVAFLPLVLAGILRWRRPLSRRDLVRIAPFFLIAVVFVCVDLWFQHHGSPEIFREASLGERVLGAAGIVWFYLGKAVLPVGLSFYYRDWNVQVSNLLWWIPLAAALALTWALWRRRRSSPFTALFAAWLYFIAALVPVMGLAYVYFMRFSLVADHYEHLALLGVTALAGSAWAGWPASRRLRWIPALVLVILGADTWTQCLHYRDLKTLYTAALEHNPDSWLAHNNLGTVLVAEGRLEPAKAEFERALQLNPKYPEAHYNLGVVLAQSGFPREAIAEDETALALRPNYPAAQNNLGNLLAQMGELAEAERRYAAAVHLRPEDPQFHVNHALVLGRLGWTQEAEAEYREALRWDPTLAQAHYGLGVSAAAEKNYSEAVRDYGEAIQLNPDYAAAYNDLGIALARLGKTEEALGKIRLALKIQPNFPEAHNNLALILAHERRWSEAADEYRQAIEQRPDYWEAHYGLGLVLQATGQKKAADDEFKKAGNKP